MPGQLYTVNPIAVNSPLVDVFTDNKRVVILIQTPQFGRVAFVAIGATLVGSIQVTVAEGSRVEKGGELGYFAFGGSTCVALVQEGLLDLDSDLRRMGSRCAAGKLPLPPSRVLAYKFRFSFSFVVPVCITNAADLMQSPLPSKHARGGV